MELLSIAAVPGYQPKKHSGIISSQTTSAFSGEFPVSEQERLLYQGLSTRRKLAIIETDV